MPRLPFPEYKPDVSDNLAGSSVTILNVVPRADGYGPFPSLQAFTAALPAACRGYFFSRNIDGTVSIFAGTSTRLYKLDNASLTWTDVSAGGSAYTTLPINAQWQFAQFNSRVIAVQANVAPQSFVVGSSSAFAALAGSPPQAAFVTIVSRFVVLSGITTHLYRIQWSDLNDPTQWSVGTGLSDFQDFADGGIVRGVAGFDLNGYIFQESAIRSMTFLPGSALVFQITKVSSGDGLYAPYAMVVAQDRVLYLSPQGFKMLLQGGYPTPIGRERIDRTFFANVDKSQPQLILAAADPQANRAYFAFKSLAGSTGLFDLVGAYDWVLDRWTLLNVSGEYISSLSRPGITIEGLDAIAPVPIAITGAADNGAGLIRLTVTATSNAYFNLATMNTIEVYGVVGTTEANDNWHFTIINSTHIDLVGSTFANAYVSGGAIGGSLDAMTVSLDDISNSALAAMSGVTSAHKVGFFSGDNLEAQLETSEQGTDARRVFIRGMRVISDAPTIYGSVSYRENPQAAYSYTDETAVNALGICPQRQSARYSRGRVRIPSGTDWTYASGVEPDVVLEGTR